MPNHAIARTTVRINECILHPCRRTSLWLPSNRERTSDQKTIGPLTQTTGHPITRLRAVATPKVDLYGRPIAPEDCVIEHQNHNGTNHGHKHAPHIKACYADVAEGIEDEASDDCADDAEHDIEQNTLAGPVNNFAGDEAGDEPENQPCDD